MSIKVTQSREQNQSSFYYPVSSSGGTTTYDHDSLMMTPCAKRLKHDPKFVKDSPYLQSSEIYIPSDIEKLNKLFPLLDRKVSDILSNF